ncbi:MAG: bifunctional tetrahydrofolate synthase/dihydrofolate synthase [Chromatocurvus sp.]
MIETPDLRAWLDYLETLHPRKIDLGLERVSLVAARLRLLPVTIPVITVAGTNGKGSVVRCATALLVAAGKRVGTYSSPHLMRYNERICIDGIPVADTLIIDAFVAIEQARDEISLTYFEFATLAALHVFRQCGAQIAVLEVGLGGRLDAVNAVDANVSVVTRIALDHQQWLGDNLDSIATEKAGIVRAGRPVVLSEAAYPVSLFSVISRRAAQPQRAGVEWHWAVRADGLIEITLPGSAAIVLPVPQGLQASNVAAAVCAVDRVGVPVETSVAERALRALVFPGRQQHLRFRDMDVILDVAHNPDASQALAAHLGTLKAARTFAVIGMLADKDVAGVVGPLVPHVSAAVVCGLPDSARSLPAQAAADAVSAAGLSVIGVADDPAGAWELLLSQSAPGSRIVVLGSFHTVGDMMALLVETGVAGNLEQTWTPR